MKLSRLSPCLLAALIACGDSTPGPEPLEIRTTSLPAGMRQVAYDQGIDVRGGTPPYTFALASGVLPAGLELAASTGRIAGLPSASGSFEFSVRVTDGVATAVSASFTLVIDAPPIVVETATLADGKVGIPYDVSLSASGGEPPIAFELASGALPAGLSLSAAGRIFGTPDASGVFELDVRAFDAVREAEKTFLLTIEANDPMLAADPLPGGRVGEPYAHDLAVSGGVPPYTFELMAGTLPSGLSISGAGRLFGSPTETGTFSFGVRVRDSGARQDERSYDIEVIEALTVVTTSPPQLIVGQPVSFQFEARGGVPPYEWRFASGRLPMGLTIESTGLLTGTPITTSEDVAGLRVTDAEGFEKLAIFTFRVSDRLVYDSQPELQIPAVCTGTTVSYNAVELEITESMQIAELDVTVDISFLDAAEARPRELRTLKLILYAPDGRRAVLCGNGAGVRGSTGCDESFQNGFLQTTFDEQRIPNVPMRVFNGMNAQGTWRLVAVVVRPTEVGGTCRVDGTIHSFGISIRPDFDPSPYVIVSGFTYNNLFIDPWIRLFGGGIPENAIDLVATIYDVGVNGIREGGQGDDVARPAPLTWSAPNGCTLADITADGHIEASAAQRAGTCDLVASGGGFVVNTEVHVLPPDWNPRVRQY